MAVVGFLNGKSPPSDEHSCASAEVLPSLGLLQHQVKLLPAEASILIDIPEIECLFIDARRDLPAAKSLTRVIQATGIDCPMIAITTEAAYLHSIAIGESLM